MDTSIKNRQIAGSFFAIMIVLFSIGNSYVEAKGKIAEPEQHSISILSQGRVTSQEGNGHRDDLVTQYDLSLFLYNSNSTWPDLMSAGPKSVRPLQVNFPNPNGCFLLPGIHAP